MSKLAKRVLYPLAFIVLLSACSTESSVYVDPSLLPSPTATMTVVDIDPSEAPTSSTSKPSTTLKAGDVLDERPEQPLPGRLKTYELRSGGFLVVKKGDPLTDVIKDDISDRVAEATNMAGESPESVMIETAWLDDADARLYDATGYRAVIVHLVLGAPEEGGGWVYRVKKDEYTSLVSQAYRTQAEAAAAAQDWVVSQKAPGFVILPDNG